jgi:hypothetical protein
VSLAEDLLARGFTGKECRLQRVPLAEQYRWQKGVIGRRVSLMEDLLAKSDAGRKVSLTKGCTVGRTEYRW